MTLPFLTSRDRAFFSVPWIKAHLEICLDQKNVAEVRFCKVQSLGLKPCSFCLCSLQHEAAMQGSQSSLVEDKKPWGGEPKFPRSQCQLPHMCMRTSWASQPSWPSSWIKPHKWSQAKPEEDVLKPWNWEIINHHCFKPQSFAVFCYTAKAKWKRNWYLVVGCCVTKPWNIAIGVGTRWQMEAEGCAKKQIVKTKRSQESSTGVWKKTQVR